MTFHSKHEYVIDWEFFRKDNTITGAVTFVPISVGLVSSAGKEFYAVSNAFQAEEIDNPWIHDHVLSKLPPASERDPLDVIRSNMEAFIQANEVGIARVWSDHHQDMTLLDGMFGGFAYGHFKNRHIRLKTRNLRDIFADHNLVPPHAPEEDKKHIAIYDARSGMDNLRELVAQQLIL